MAIVKQLSSHALSAQSTTVSHNAQVPLTAAITVTTPVSGMTVEQMRQQGPINVHAIGPGTAVIYWSNFRDGQTCTVQLEIDAEDEDVTPDTVQAGDGSVSAPSISFSGDTNTGLYRIGADNVGLSLGGTKVLDASSTSLSSGSAVDYISGKAAPASVGTGITASSNGALRRALIKLAIPRTVFVAAAQTETVTLCTLPAKSRVVSVVCDLTQVFALGGAALTLEVGRTGDTDGFIAQFDADAATATKGLADADLGADMTRAAAIQGGYLLSWSSAVAVTATLTSGTTNLGNATTTSLTTGAATVYLVVEYLA